MRLFIVRYTSGYGCEQTYLTVGESKDEVYKREREKLNTSTLWVVSFSVKEVDEVEGYKIMIGE